MGSCKLNVDVAYHANGTGAVGGVMRNHLGEDIAGMTCPMKNILDASTAEALALLKRINMPDQLGCSSIMVESDSLELIQACNGVIVAWSPYSAILAECFMKASTINGISFHHCPREENKVAHEIARNAYSTKEFLSWDGDPPGFIKTFVINDVTLLSNEYTPLGIPSKNHH
jgi:ribonuclease HI